MQAISFQLIKYCCDQTVPATETQSIVLAEAPADHKDESQTILPDTKDIVHLDKKGLNITHRKRIRLINLDRFDRFIIKHYNNEY
jgi:hypothetical protein